jgi:hypothetical protein
MWLFVAPVFPIGGDGRVGVARDAVPEEFV